MAQLKVFFSHLTIESQLAELIQQAIMRDFIGLVSFFISSDITSIPAGQKWIDRIVQHMKDSDLHFVLCSPEALRRPWISLETGAACMRGVEVIPICHSGLTPTQLPVPLSQFEAIQASDRAGLTKLYATIASKIGSAVPEGGLADLLRDIATFERDYQKKVATAAACELTPASVGVIVSPRVLCVSSKQFLKEGIADLEIITKAFPTTVAHIQLLTPAEVRDALRHERFDIVHVATYVCPATGDLVFSDINTETGEEICQPREFLTADAFAALIKTDRVRLVVIASCESFELAAHLMPVTNVIATRDMVDPRMFAAWIENFYGVLPSNPLSEAFDYAVKASRAPMKLYAKQELIMKQAESESPQSASTVA
jgi:TIR domain